MRNELCVLPTRVRVEAFVPQWSTVSSYKLSKRLQWCQTAQIQHEIPHHTFIH
jgi:hypothetical protein